MSGIEYTSQNNPGHVPNAMETAFAGASKAQTANIPPQNTGTSNSNGDPFGFSGISLREGVIGYSPIRNAMGTEGYAKLSKLMKEMAKDHKRNDKLEIRVLELDHNFNTNLHFSSFVIAVQSVVAPQLGVGYNVVMFESTGEPLMGRTEGGQNGEPQVAIPAYPEDANNDIYKGIVEQLLRTAYGQNVRLFHSELAVIPSDFKHTDTAAVEALMANSAAAASSSLVMFAEGGKYFHDLRLVQDLKARRAEGGDTDLTFQTRFERQRKVDFLMLPKRASVVVQSATGARKTRNLALNSGQGPKTLTEATGFIELVPVAPRQVAPVFNPNTGTMQQMSNQRLVPVFVLNSITSTFGLTPASCLLGILVAADLNRGAGWVQAFQSQPTTKSSGIDLTDVTAIVTDMASMTNPGQPEVRPAVPTGGLTIPQLTQFLGTYCRPNAAGQVEMYMAMDVPIAGHSSWYLSIFQAAALGNQAAIDFIIRSFDDITENRFSAQLPKGTPLFATAPMVMETGYWETEDGRRDVADVDFVAVCNYADAVNNPGLIERWNNTFFGQSESTAQNLARRREIIMEVTGQRARFIGRSVRLFWNGEVLSLALSCLQQAGITTTTDGRGMFSFTSGHSQAGFLDNRALLPGAGWSTSNGVVNQQGYNTSTMWGAGR